MRRKEIGIEIHVVDNKIKRKLDQVASEYEVTGIQYVMMHYIYHNGKSRAICQRDLEKAFDIRRSSVSNIIGLLEKKGYIQRIPVQDDARLKQLILSETGTEILFAVEHKMKHVEQCLLDALAPQEQDQFFQMLAKISEAIEEL